MGVHHDCAAPQTFCYWGSCAPCSECHFCHDGIDGTCGLCGAPIYEPNGCLAITTSTAASSPDSVNAPSTAASTVNTTSTAASSPDSVNPTSTAASTVNTTSTAASSP